MSSRRIELSQHWICPILSTNTNYNPIEPLIPNARKRNTRPPIASPFHLDTMSHLACHERSIKRLLKSFKTWLRWCSRRNNHNDSHTQDSKTTHSSSSSEPRMLASQLWERHLAPLFLCLVPLFVSKYSHWRPTIGSLPNLRRQRLFSSFPTLLFQRWKSPFPAPIDIISI